MDVHTWVHSSSDQFSAYRTFFMGAITFEPWKRLWRSWAPLQVKFFIFLAIRNRCWTEDRLVGRGLPHPARCLLCEQAEENVQHILTDCMFAREVWFQLFSRLGITTLAPQVVILSLRIGGVMLIAAWSNNTRKGLTP